MSSWKCTHIKTRTNTCCESNRCKRQHQYAPLNKNMYVMALLNNTNPDQHLDVLSALHRKFAELAGTTGFDNQSANYRTIYTLLYRYRILFVCIAAASEWLNIVQTYMYVYVIICMIGVGGKLQHGKNRTKKSRRTGAILGPNDAMGFLPSSSELCNIL